jgi:hypothetical protein
VRPYLEKTLHKNKAGGVAQGVGPELKPQHHKKKKKKKSWELKPIQFVPQSLDPIREEDVEEGGNFCTGYESRPVS